MKDLILIINEIVKYGLQPNLAVEDRDKLLQKNLIKIYSIVLDLSYDLDNSEYLDTDKIQYHLVRQNVETNFTNFGLYRTTIGDIEDFDSPDEFGVGDAIDDLTDIIFDLLEVKARIENNSINSGLEHFEVIFYCHTQQHILDLLNYMKQINGLPDELRTKFNE